jgi:hypothetical protein
VRAGKGRPEPVGRWQDVRNTDGSVVAEARREHDPYGQAIDDPAFLEAVGAAYRGRLAVLDALWWLAHPDDPAPDGRPAPSATLRALQRRAFAADGDAAGDHAVAAAILTAEAELTAERAAIDSAVATARASLAGVPGESVVAAEPVPTDPVPAGAVDALGGAAGQGGSTGSPDTRGARGTPRSRVLLAAVFTAAVALGAVLGGVATNLSRSAPSATEGPATMPTSDAAPTAVAPVLIGRIFDRVQTFKDVPVATMPEIFVPESFRYLGSAGWTDADVDGITDTPYYAARGAEGTVCLVVVREHSGYLSTCALEAAYPAAGLRLTWQTEDLHPAKEDGQGMVLDITVTWQSDATVQTRGSGRPRASS